MNSLFINKVDEDSGKYKKLLLDDTTNPNENGEVAAPSNSLFPPGFNILNKRERRP